MLYLGEFDANQLYNDRIFASMTHQLTLYTHFVSVQVLYGFYMAGEVAYYTYMYAKVEKEKYQKVTGNARASQQVGRFVASVMAQILISSEAMDVRELNYITFASESIRLISTFSVWNY